MAFMRLQRLHIRIVKVYRQKFLQYTGEANPEVMQGTADLHHEIADAVLPQPHPVFNDPTPLDAFGPVRRYVKAHMRSNIGR